MFKCLNIKNLIIFSLVAIFLLPLAALALNYELSIPLPGLARVEDFGQFLKFLYRTALIFVGVAAMGGIIYGGVIWMTSAGNPDKIKNAKTKITDSVVGLIIVLSAVIILRTINPDLVRPETRLNPLYLTAPSPRPGTCNLFSARWKKDGSFITSARVGDRVTLEIDAFNCKDWTVQFDIFDDDITFDEYITSFRNVPFDERGVKASREWTIDKTYDMSTMDGQHFFKARASKGSERSNEIRSNTIMVRFRSQT